MKIATENLPPLCRAAQSGDLEECRKLLALSTSIGETGLGLITPLHLAVQEKQLNVIRLLIENKVNINARTKKDLGFPGNETPLYWAVEFRFPEIVRLLLENGANPNLKSSIGTSPLSVAAGVGDESIVKLLLEAGALPSNKANSDALPSALLGRRLTIAELLIKAGADVNICIPPSSTPIINAVCESKWLAGAEFLKKWDADFHKLDRYGQSALHSAVLGYASRTIKTEMTPFGPKTTRSDPDDAVGVVEYVLKVGVNPKTIDKNGMSALDLAKKIRAPKIAELIDTCIKAAP